MPTEIKVTPYKKVFFGKLRGQALTGPSASMPYYARFRLDELYIGGFMGEWNKVPSGQNCTKKLALLKTEGVEFNDKGVIIDREQLWDEFEL